MRSREGEMGARERCAGVEELRARTRAREVEPRSRREGGGSLCVRPATDGEGTAMDGDCGGVHKERSAIGAALGGSVERWPANEEPVGGLLLVIPASVDESGGLLVVGPAYVNEVGG